MSSEDTLLGNELILAIGDGNSPEGFTDFCAVGEVSGLGETKTTVDVTTLCDLVRTFRGGLAEGSEVTITANLIQGDEDVRDMFDHYKADDVVHFRLTMRGVSPAEYFAFGGPVTAWNIANPIGDKATMSFTLKLSGGVDWIHD